MQERSPGIFCAVWCEKGNWQYKIEKRVGKWVSWGGGGYDTEEAARAMMEDKLLGVLALKN